MRIQVGDACVRSNRGATRWWIGTRTATLGFALRNGRVVLDGLTGAAGDESVAYLAGQDAVPPFEVEAACRNDHAFVDARGERTVFGGQPVAQLTLACAAGALEIRYRVIAFPGTAILRMWVELSNAGTVPVSAAATPGIIPLSTGGRAFTHYWMIGGNSSIDHGMLRHDAVSGSYNRTLEAQATADYVPWSALQCAEAPRHGLFLALEYLGNWQLRVARDDDGAMTVSAEIPDLANVALAPGESIALPAVTLGLFAGTLDDMMVGVYDWQYRYLWDGTNIDYYARPKWAAPWFYCAQNLQEQFAERLACLDMDAELMRSVGFEMLWDDAGWSIYDGLPSDDYRCVFTSGYEGPDFRRTLRYLEKMEMRWLAWFTQRPSPGVMAAKVGAWGDFEWRSDAVSFPDWSADRDWRARILRFLHAFPGCSFHTCSGGSTYAHTFDIPRYANTNYFSDGGRGPQTNYYFSYLEPPDKWVDIIEPWTSRGAYRPETARQTLAMVPFWGLRASDGDRACLRRDLEIYRFLRDEGVAGRWSYSFHPAVEGDEEFYYAQRTAYDRTRACIILKHLPPGPVTIYPRGLLPGHRYLVEFDKRQESDERTGAALMADGIALPNPQPGELIYLGLPNRPRSGRDAATPPAPGAVLARRETNLGQAGMALYWSPGAGGGRVSGYEVRRDDTILDTVCTGLMYFDHGDGWSPEARYTVRTLDGNGNASPWTAAARLPDEPLAFSSLGGLFPRQSQGGWRAETSADGRTFRPMRFIAPPATASADEGGTPNQSGGVEGWWEGEGARLGRAWMQSSPTACCVRAWTAPRTGMVRVVSRVMKEWYRQETGDPLRARVLHGDRQVWPAEGWADILLGDLTGAVHDLTLSVTAGDPIRFMLDRQPCPRASCLHFGETWTVFGPFAADAELPPAAELAHMPEAVPVGDRRAERREIAAPAGPLDLAAVPGCEGGAAALVCIPIEVDRADLYQLGIDLTGWYAAWLDGRPISSTMIGGNEAAAACRERHLVNVRMVAGRHLLALHAIRNPAAFQLDVGLPAVAAGEIAAWMPAIAYCDEAPAPRPGSVVRINCGAARSHRDSQGNHWERDRDFQGGHPSGPSAAIDGTDDPALYRRSRQGRDFQYLIPVDAGLYSVRLRFAEPAYRCLFARPFTVEINGREVLRNYDICQDARGYRRAHDRLFRGVVPGADGCIVLRFSGGFEPGQATDEAIVQALEILPELRPAVRINCGGHADFIDWNSTVWTADPHAHSETLQTACAVRQASPTAYDQGLYQTARCGRDIVYHLPLPSGHYTVHLKFAELWLREPDRRPMDIRINGRRLWQDWDPGADAGGPGAAIDLRAQGIVPDAGGAITVRLEATGCHPAILQGIEIE